MPVVPNIPSLLNELSLSLSSQTNVSTQLLPLLRRVYTALSTTAVVDTSISSRLIVELHALLVMDHPASGGVGEDVRSTLLLIAGIIRLLIPTTPNHPITHFPKNQVSSVSVDRLQFVLPLRRELGAPLGKTGEELETLTRVLSDEAAPVGLRIETLAYLVGVLLDGQEEGGVKLQQQNEMFLSRIDEVVSGIIGRTSCDITSRPDPHNRGVVGKLSSFLTRGAGGGSSGAMHQPLELDGTAVTPGMDSSIFTAVVHMKSPNGFSDQHLVHIATFSLLSQFLATRPPSQSVTESTVSLSLRVLAQCQREVSPLILDGKRRWKFIHSTSIDQPGSSAQSGDKNPSLGMNSPLVRWTREFVETVLVETVKCLDLICSAAATHTNTPTPRMTPALTPSTSPPPSSTPSSTAFSTSTGPSTIFPHVRRVFDRVVLRADSPGIAATATVRFLLNHSKGVVFDTEPVLAFFFTTHLPKLVGGPQRTTGDSARLPVLAMDAALFLAEYVEKGYGCVFVKFFPAILRLAGWFPRSAGVVLIPVVRELIHASCVNEVEGEDRLVDMFHSVLDMGLAVGLNELSLSVEDYVGGPSGAEEGLSGVEDQFTNGRTMMRLIRSVEFRSILDYANRATAGGNIWMAAPGVTTQLLCELWCGLSPTPRVSAASKLVIEYLRLLLGAAAVNPPSGIFRAILTRFGSGKIFMFKPEIARLCIDFITSITHIDRMLLDHAPETVSAILERIGASSDELVTHLVNLIGRLSSTEQTGGIPLFVRTLRFILSSPTSPAESALPPQEEVVYIRNGRIVAKPNDSHPLLDQMVDHPSTTPQPSVELQCVVITALTRLAATFPQYRAQTLSLLSSVGSCTPSALIRERITESSLLLSRFDVSRQLTAPAPATLVNVS